MSLGGQNINTLRYTDDNTESRLARNMGGASFFALGAAWGQGEGHRGQYISKNTKQCTHKNESDKQS